MLVWLWFCRYWPVIEDALKRSAVDRNVSVCLLVSCGRESDPAVWPFIRSLDALHSPSDNINMAVVSEDPETRSDPFIYADYTASREVSSFYLRCVLYCVVFI